MPSTEENAVQNFLVRVQSMMICAAAESFVRNYDRIMRGELRAELLADSPARTLSDALSDIAYRYAFNSKEILRIELSVSEMMNCLLERLSGRGSAVRNTPGEDHGQQADQRNIRELREDMPRRLEQRGHRGVQPPDVGDGLRLRNDRRIRAAAFPGASRGGFRADLT